MSVCGWAVPAPDSLPASALYEVTTPENDACALVSVHRPTASTEKETLSSPAQRRGQG